MTALQQRLVVSGKRLVLPLPSRMVLLPWDRGAARRAEGYVVQRFVFPQSSLSLVLHPRTPSPLRGTSPISGEEYLALCLGQLLYVVCPLFSCLVKHGVTGIKQRLVVSGKRLVFPLPSRMVLLP